MEGQDIGWVLLVNAEFIMSNGCINRREEENKDLKRKFSRMRGIRRLAEAVDSECCKLQRN